MRAKRRTHPRKRKRNPSGTGALSNLVQGMDSDDNAAADAYGKGVQLLARREHAVAELAGKLKRQGFDGDAVSRAVDRLVDDGYLSDARFTEAFVRHRCEQGQGPVKIRAALAERGIDEALAQEALERQAVDWLEQARAARRKRFGGAPPADKKERARQARFLAGRGFESEHVYRVVDPRDDDEG